MRETQQVATPSADVHACTVSRAADDPLLTTRPFDLPDGFRLSVVVPVLNERNTLPEIVDRIRATQIPCEIILVDDGSTDGSRELALSWQGLPDITVGVHDRNRGKGSAIRTGFQLASGQAIVVQDADLEYHPSDFWRMLEPILGGKAEVVFGSRFASADNACSPLWHRAANRLLTATCNWATGLSLTDMETCYKMVRRDVLARILPDLKETGFGIEPELTLRLARLPGVRICEVPVSYRGRNYAAGKKILWSDGVWALWCIFRYGLLKR
jgi:glycosyltransferase involved in cell wall biosynthesis